VMCSAWTTEFLLELEQWKYSRCDHCGDEAKSGRRYNRSPCGFDI